MIVDGILAFCLLGLPALFPVVRLVGWSPAALFLAPLGGALLAGLGAMFELAFGGTILAWYIGLALAANLAAFGAWVHRPRNGAHVASRGPGYPDPADPTPPSEGGVGWGVVVVAVIGAAVAWPLQALGARILAYDANAIWVVHAVLVYGGHHVLRVGLTNPALHGSNPDYPPLIPAASALGFNVAGHVVYDMEIAVAAVLNACALGVLGCGVVAAARARGRVSAPVALAAAAALCLVAFGLAGIYAVGGYADLLWSAGAAGAVVYGLILPPTTRHVRVAWLCATVAMLTKNEGLAVSIVILALVSIRFLPLPDPSGPTDQSWAQKAGRTGPTWLRRLGLTAAMALPGLAWSILVRAEGIGDGFFSRSSGQTTSLRISPVVSAMTHQLRLLPVVVALAAVCGLFLSDRRRRLGLGNDLWLWVVLAASVLLVGGTYLLGDLEVHWWLRTSVDRTTIFAQLLLYVDVGMWMVVAASSFDDVRRRRRVPAGDAPGEPDVDDDSPGDVQTGPARPGPAVSGPGPEAAPDEPVLEPVFGAPGSLPRR